MVNLIDLEQDGLHNIMSNELKPRISEMVHHVLLSAGEEIINDDHIVASLHQLIDQMTADEAGPAGDDNPHPLPGNPDGHSPDPGGAISAATPGRGIHGERLLVGEVERVGSRNRGRRAEMRKAGLDDEESGANENTDEDEQKPLLSEEIVDGSG